MHADEAYWIESYQSMTKITETRQVMNQTITSFLLTRSAASKKGIFALLRLDEEIAEESYRRKESKRREALQQSYTSPRIQTSLQSIRRASRSTDAMKRSFCQLLT